MTAPRRALGYDGQPDRPGPGGARSATSCGTWPFTAVGLWAAWPTSVVFDGTQRQLGLKSGPVAFSAVRALQIVRERVSSDKGSYYSYELNLVLEEGQRLNLCDHGNLTRLRKDAARVRALIGCKLWDATRYQE